jgi:hypothetical protein
MVDFQALALWSDVRSIPTSERRRIDRVPFKIEVWMNHQVRESQRRPWSLFQGPK